MMHTCHYPGCTQEVPPSMWGCRPHWFSLPADLRKAVWKAYVPGQEITKTPSAEYLAVADRVQKWCLLQESKKLLLRSLRDTAEQEATFTEKAALNNFRPAIDELEKEGLVTTFSGNPDAGLLRVTLTNAGLAKARRMKT